jgi:hypothetical protein
MTGTRPAWWSTAAVALGAGLLAVACSSGSTPASGTSPSGTPSASASATPTATTLVCQDAADLRTSLHNLTHSKVSTGGVTELKSNLAQVRTDLTSLTTDAKGQWQTQTTALKAALDKLQTAISDLSSSPPQREHGGRRSGRPRRGRYRWREPAHRGQHEMPIGVAQLAVREMQLVRQPG